MERFSSQRAPASTLRHRLLVAAGHLARLLRRRRDAPDALAAHLVEREDLARRVGHRAAGQRRARRTVEPAPEDEGAALAAPREGVVERVLGEPLGGSWNTIVSTSATLPSGVTTTISVSRLVRTMWLSKNAVPTTFPSLRAT